MRVPWELVYLYIVNIELQQQIRGTCPNSLGEKRFSRVFMFWNRLHGLLPNKFTYLESDLWKRCRLLLEQQTEKLQDICKSLFGYGSA